MPSSPIKVLLLFGWPMTPFHLVSGNLPIKTLIARQRLTSDVIHRVLNLYLDQDSQSGTVHEVDIGHGLRSTFVCLLHTCGCNLVYIKASIIDIITWDELKYILCVLIGCRHTVWVYSF